MWVAAVGVIFGVGLVLGVIFALWNEVQEARRKSAGDMDVEEGLALPLHGVLPARQQLQQQPLMRRPSWVKPKRLKPSTPPAAVGYALAGSGATAMPSASDSGDYVSAEALSAGLLAPHRFIPRYNPSNHAGGGTRLRRPGSGYGRDDFPGLVGSPRPLPAQESASQPQAGAWSQPLLRSQPTTEVLDSAALEEAVTVRGVGLRHSSPIFNRGNLLGTTSSAGQQDAGDAKEEIQVAGEAQKTGEATSGMDLQGKDLAYSSAGSYEIAYEELEVGKLIGGGGFGQVYRGRWRGTNVAIKILLTAVQSDVDDSLVDDFREECEILASLRHPNICLFIAAVMQPPKRAIVTELVSRGSLWEALRGQAPLPEPQDRHYATPQGVWPWSTILKVADGMACGMNYLHCHTPPIIHRDLKSANLLLDDSYTPKICDFGLARWRDLTCSMTGNCGTVQWMAPEVLANDRYSETADVYSFSIVVWELLARSCPFEGMSSIQVALAVLNRSSRPSIPDWTPAPLKELLLTCWAQEAARRPTMAHILHMLRAEDMLKPTELYAA
jgi:tRNA A-37 threonylcarbamoyl transferase component Bud32